MIDTDKYEGHTRGPWYGKAKTPRIHSIGASGDGKMVGIWYGTEKVEREDPSEDPYESIRAVKPSGEWTDWAKVDVALIADAPLLLEEVKRLRGLLDEIDDVVYYNDEKAGQVLPVEKPNLELLRDIMMSYTDEAYQIRGDEGEWIE